jgi:AbrB family looped-hinge helix DNA binding protein
MKKISSMVTSKGQVTIPAEVRRHLGVDKGNTLTFIINDDGAVALRIPKFLEVASLAGAAGLLKEPLVCEIAREDRFDVKHADEA